MSRLLQTKITLLFSCHPSYQTELRVQNYPQEIQECKAPSSFTNAVSLGDEGARVTTWVDWTTLKEPSPDLLTLEAKSCGANNHKSSSQHFNTRPIAGEKRRLILSGILATSVNAGHTNQVSAISLTTVESISPLL